MQKLTQQEEEAMLVVWKTGEANVKSFLEQMPEPKPPYTTLASTIKNLEKKGYVVSRQLGNMFLYKALIRESDYKKKFINTVVKDYFEDSYKELVTFFAKEKKITAAELKEIIHLIEQKKP
jgi:BlaI family transcriptional regulator, penicillinase repressor